ncbi:hypothetical protein [Amycolatopsis sp. NPDC058986]|uniref:hypothetical protein n=1 Tax=unclassified Amycolatopsis TaxID=2618356 RepID=UPI00366EE224
MASQHPHRVVCRDYTHQTRNLAAAQGYLAGVESAGHCQLPHTIEVHIEGRWVPLHIALAREILAADLRTVVDTPDGRLVKARGGWSKQKCEHADRAANVSSDPKGWAAALGPHEHATLTADGRGARTDSWCQCEPEPTAETWIRYERWTMQGRAVHGYLCPGCRGLTQTG